MSKNMPGKNLFALLLTAAALILFGSRGYGQALYSYTDDSGVRVFTNIAPAEPVTDLVITGSPPSPALPVAGTNSESLNAMIEKYAGLLINKGGFVVPDDLPEKKRKIGDQDHAVLIAVGSQLSG